MTHRIAQKWSILVHPKALPCIEHTHEKIYLVIKKVCQSLGVLGIPHGKENCMAQALQMHGHDAQQGHENAERLH